MPVAENHSLVRQRPRESVGVTCRYYRDAHIFFRPIPARVPDKISLFHRVYRNYRRAKSHHGQKRRFVARDGIYAVQRDSDSRAVEKSAVLYERRAVFGIKGDVLFVFDDKFRFHKVFYLRLGNTAVGCVVAVCRRKMGEHPENPQVFHGGRRFSDCRKSEPVHSRIDFYENFRVVLFCKTKGVFVVHERTGGNFAGKPEILAKAEYRDFAVYPVFP